MLGTKIFAVIPEQEAVPVVETILDTYRKLGRKGERLGDVIQRIGLDSFQQKMINN